MGNDKKTILVVDSDPQMRLTLSRTLAKCDYDVSTAEDGLDALRKLEDNIPDFIISDISMPVLDGLELLKALHKRPETSNIPFVVFTAKNDTAVWLESVNAGAKAYFQKSTPMDEFVSKINKLVHENQGHRR